MSLPSCCQKVSADTPAAALVPAAGPGEGRVAAEEDVGHHPEAPEVVPPVVHQVLLHHHAEQSIVGLQG